MKQLLLILFLLNSGNLLGQTIEVIPWKPSPVIAGEQVSSKSTDGQSSRSALFLSDNAVFPHLATGGGWETVVVMVNMSSVTMSYSTYFYDQKGQPMTITFREYPSMNVVNATAIKSTLPPHASFNFALFDATPQTQVGWAAVDYDTTKGRLGGYAIFRQRITGRPDFEALVPLSSYTDSKFYLPVDELQGFVTAMAICNPASNSATTLTLQMLGMDGVEKSRKTLTLESGNQTAFVIRDLFPEMVDKVGTLLVQGSTNRLAGLGLRFNTSGGNAFSSVPIMNWLGMFQ